MVLLAIDHGNDPVTAVPPNTCRRSSPFTNTTTSSVNKHVEAFHGEAAVFTAVAQEGHMWHKGIFLPAFLAPRAVSKETPVGKATRWSSKRKPRRVMQTMRAGWQFLCHGICMLEHASIIKIPGGQTKEEGQGKVKQRRSEDEFQEANP
ncbi:uncharacterized [Tachysurus ichikawai]